MRKDERFNNILNECLDRILKGETVEQCLLIYPEQAKELEPLLRTAKTARIISSVQPRPEFKAEARRQFQAALINVKVKQNELKSQAGHRWHWRWQSGWAIALVVVVVIVLGGGGTIAAASGSMPDSNLYNVKLAAENIQLTLAPGEIAKTTLNAKFADHRTDELVYMATKGDAQEVQIVATRLNTNLSNISQIASGNSGTVSEYNEKTSYEAAPQPALLSDTTQTTDAEANVPASTVNPEQIDSAPKGLTAPMVNAAPTGDRSSSTAPEGTQAVQSDGNADNTVGTPGAGNQTSASNSKLTKYQKLRVIIQENYEKRKQKLLDALKKAAWEVRPPIRQAIIQSDNEYERAMKNLETSENAENFSNNQDLNNTQN
jgi:hypothetical protein